LNPCFSHDHVLTKCLSSLELTTPSKTATTRTDSQTTALPGVTPRDRRPRGRPRPPFRNVIDSPPAAVRPPSSPPCSVYHSLSIAPVGAVTPPGGHGSPASGLQAPRRRAHRAPPGHRRAPAIAVREAPSEREFREFLMCGVFEHGVARFRCEGCGREHLVPFSCKGGVVSQLRWRVWHSMPLTRAGSLDLRGAR